MDLNITQVNIISSVYLPATDEFETSTATDVRKSLELEAVITWIG